MTTFYNQSEIEKYYNAKNDTYEFIEDGERMDVNFEFGLYVGSNILAGNIEAFNIEAYDIEAYDINANDIVANDINYYAICAAYQNIKCNSIKGRHKNAKHFCLDGEIIITPKIEEMTLAQVCEALGKEIKIVKES